MYFYFLTHSPLEKEVSQVSFGFTSVSPFFRRCCCTIGVNGTLVAAPSAWIDGDETAKLASGRRNHGVIANSVAPIHTN